MIQATGWRVITGSRAIGVASLGMALVAGCDLPPAVASDGPRVVRVTPDPAGGPIDRLPTFRIELDRRIAPGSLPQGVVELTSGDVYVWVDLEIDVVHPAIVAMPTDALDPEVDYHLVVHALRDLDGHVSGDTAPLTFHTTTTVTPREAASITFDDVAPTLSGCAAAGCHVGADAALGLDLSSAAAIRATAVGVAAREVAPSVTGALGIEVTAALLGMPRIDRRNPARSYLLYTMLGDDHIAGAPMPPDGALASEAQLVELQRWIQAGAPGL